MPNTRSGLCNVINCEISGGKWLIYVKITVLLTGDGYVASTAKRLGEEGFFSEAFVVFHHISVIFRVFCFEVMVSDKKKLILFVLFENNNYLCLRILLDYDI